MSRLLERAELAIQGVLTAAWDAGQGPLPVIYNSGAAQVLPRTEIKAVGSNELVYRTGLYSVAVEVTAMAKDAVRTHIPRAMLRQVEAILLENLSAHELLGTGYSIFVYAVSCAGRRDIAGEVRASTLMLELVCVET